MLYLGRVKWSVSSSCLSIFISCLPPLVNCGMPHDPVNGSTDNIQSISTVGGAQIFFRCNERFVPAGRMSATCVSSSGRWVPNPADLVCIGELQNRHKDSSHDLYFMVCVCRILSTCVV